MFITALFTKAKIWKQPKFPSIDEWIEKLWYMYMVEYYSAVKKNNLPIVHNKDESRGHYTKWNKSDKEKQLPCDINYMWNVKKKMDKQNVNRLKNENKWVVVRRVEDSGWAKWVRKLTGTNFQLQKE